MDSSFSADGFRANDDTQRFIESYVQTEFDNNVDTKPNYVAKVDTSILGAPVSNYIHGKTDLLNVYIDSLFEAVEHEFNKYKNIKSKSKNNNVSVALVYEVLTKVGKKPVSSICMHQFLLVLTHQDSHNENNNYTNLLGLSINIGKTLVQRYLSEINTVEEGVEKPSYSRFYETWKSNNKAYGELLEEDDTFYSTLGCKIIEVLEFSDMLKKLLVRTEQKKQHHELVISDEDLMSKIENHKIYTVPAKLPMIVKPKPYSIGKDGGYLLNDVDYHETLKFCC